MSANEIIAVGARRVWDSRGRPTVEAEITLHGGIQGRAIAPAGASRGSNEAIDLRDGGTAFGGLGVDQAVANVNSEIAAALIGRDAGDQQAIDSALIELDGTTNKARLGGNATVAVSMAVAHSAAAAQHLPLWRYLAGDAIPRLPLPQVQIFGGGAHAGRRVDVQDFLVMPVGAKTLDQAFVWIAEVYRAAGELMAEAGPLAGVADEGGWWPNFSSNEEALEMLVRAIERAGLTPGDEMAIALDVAASEFAVTAGDFAVNSGYRLALENRDIDSDRLIEMLISWIDRYPIVSVEDPVDEADTAGMIKFTKAVGHRVQVIGDDYLVTNAARIDQAVTAGACNAVLLKPNQAGTISEARAALEAARGHDWGTVVSARSGESEDATVTHLSVGWDAGQLKVGSFARSERMVKWNEALRIEVELGGDAHYVGGADLPAYRGK